MNLILLVGSNPVPNYLAAMALKPAKITLVYSEKTKDPKERLASALSKSLSGVQIDHNGFVNDPFSASDVGVKIRELISDATDTHLHYTGGTKVMSAHALKAFYERNGVPANASYLDEAQVRLRFDDGDVKPISEIDLQFSLDRILQLHGVTQKKRDQPEGSPQADDVEAIATAVMRRPQLSSCLYGERRRLEDGKIEEAKETPCIPEDYGLQLSVPVIPPRDGMNKGCFEAWFRFIGGEWLEDWVAARIKDVKLDGGIEITIRVNCKRQKTKRTFEVDVAVIRGQRSYFISCTTDMTRGICKSKAFEVLVRARQMGGDLARSALVSLLPSHIVGELQEDVDDAWGSPNTTKIFGLEDIRTWGGYYGSPNFDNLKEWLDS